MEAEYTPEISYENCEFFPKNYQMTFGNNDLAIEAPRFVAHNYGGGRAMHMSSEIIVSPEISLNMGRESIIQAMRGMAEQVEAPEPVRRKETSLENPYNSLGSGESDRFIGEGYFQYLPTGEFYSCFQEFDDHGLEIGDEVAAVLVTDYQDRLGNSYRDIPYGQVLQYVPSHALSEFPADHPDCR